jgi:5-methylcytosine-specific restriction endonuclease McrA
MSNAVLFLDAEWRPLRVEGWERAITDLFLKKIEVIEYSRDRTIKGVTEELRLPSVVRVLRKFDRRRIRLKFSRLNVHTRDKFRCQYCAERFPTEELTFDHVVPRSRGGRTTWENIVTCCAECNRKKAARTPEEAGMKLLAKPKKPVHLPTVTVQMRPSDVPTEWQPYWHSPLDS